MYTWIKVFDLIRGCELLVFSDEYDAQRYLDDRWDALEGKPDREWLHQREAAYVVVRSSYELNDAIELGEWECLSETYDLPKGGGTT